MHTQPNIVVVTCFVISCAGLSHAADLISHYKFDGSGANEVANAPDGVLVDGAAFTAGVSGQALSLEDGAWVDLSDEGFPSNDAGMFSGSVAFWVRWNGESPPSNVQFLGNLNAGDQTALLVGTNGASGMQIFPRSIENTALIARDGGEGDVLNPDLSWADGEWHHLAYTWDIDDAGGIAEFYIDGDPLPQINYRSNNLTTADEFAPWEFSMALGGRNNRGTLDSLVTADLDDFRIYDGMLSEDEVLDLLDVDVSVPGDFNNDGVLNAVDIDLLSTAVRTGDGDPIYDVDQNGAVEPSDRVHWIEELADTYIGDSNLDGEFSSGDLVFVFTPREYEDDLDGNSTWATGDWNGDAEFDSGDLVTAFTGGGYELGPRAATQAVPEPANGFVLLLIVFQAVASISRRER